MASGPPLPTPWAFDATRDPLVYTRPMVGSELAMQRHWNAFDADSEVCMGANFTSSMSANELRDRAREALDKLRFVCPIIACTVEDVVSPRWVYTPSGDRKAWLNLAFAVEERGESLRESEFVQSINLKRLPYTDGDGTSTLFKAYLLTTSKEFDDGNKEYGLYFHSTHSIIDAGPALHALNLMCEWMSGEGIDITVRPLEEWKNLPVDPITAVGGPFDSKEWESAGVKLLQEVAEQNVRTVPSHTLAPPTRPLIMSHPSFHYTISSSESQAAAIITATKRLGISISALFHAAHCLAQIKMNPIPEGKEVDFSANWTVASLERYLKPPVDPRTYFISSFTMIPLRFSMGQVLLESSEKARLVMTAKILQERFGEYLANPCLPHLLVALQGVPATEAEQVTETQHASQAGAEKAPMSWEVAFNNLGMVEKKLRTQHGRITVDNICLGVRLRNFLTIHMWMLHSKLHFQIHGATAWGEECIKTLLEETRRIGFLVLDDFTDAEA